MSIAASPRKVRVAKPNDVVASSSTCRKQMPYEKSEELIMLDLDQWSTSRLLLTAARLLENAWNKELADSGVTYAGLTVLMAVSLHGNTKAELARKVQVRPQTLGRILDRLERKAFIARIPTKSDQKEQLFTITPAGTSVVAQTIQTEHRILREDILFHQKLRQLLKDIVTQLTHTERPNQTSPPLDVSHRSLIRMLPKFRGSSSRGKN